MVGSDPINGILQTGYSWLASSHLATSARCPASPASTAYNPGINIQDRDENFEVKVKPGEREIQGQEIYALSPGTFRGNCCIVNFDEFKCNKYERRLGSQKDVKNLSSLFSQMGFKVEEVPTRNMKANDFHKVLNTVLT